MSERASHQVVFSMPLLPARSLGIALLVVPALTLGARSLPDDSPWLAALKVLLAVLTVGVLPGVAVIGLFHPCRRQRLLELIGTAIAVSLVLVQGATFISIGAHLACGVISLGWAIALAAAGVLLLARGTNLQLIVRPGELAILLALAGLAILLYFKGSPFFSDEDQLHAAVARRLAAHPHPALDNFYHAPGVVYTHPFPGIHYFVALVSRLSEADALFIYCKLRFFWGASALLFLYLAARVVFRSAAVAAVVFWTGLAFVLNGTFAEMPSFFWGQLIPYSHASDVAMNVLLPALLTMSCTYYTARATRRRRFYLAMATTLALMVAVVHIREIVQFLVCNGGLLLGCVLLRRWALAGRVLALWLAATLFAAGYGAFHHHVIGHVASTDEAVKTALRATLQSSSWWGLLAAPHRDCMCAFDALFWGWNPLLTLCVPLLLLAFPGRPLVWLAGGGCLLYLLIIRLPLLSIPYVLLTYYEILMTPVRNLVFFNYLAAGAGCYLLARWCSHFGVRRLDAALDRLAKTSKAASRRRTPKVCLAALLACVLAGIGAWGERTWRTWPDLLFVPAMGLGMAAVVVGTSRWNAARCPRPVPGWQLPCAVLIATLAILTLRLGLSPLTVHTVNTGQPPFPDVAPVVLTPNDLVRKFTLRPPAAGAAGIAATDPHLLFRRSAPPSLGLLRWARRCLPPDAVLAVNGFNYYSPAAFLPQQLAAWPLVLSNTLTNVRALCPRYYEFLDRARARGQVQPFFSTSETLDERREFLRALRITHIVVDPMTYPEMKPILGSWPGMLRLAYDDGKWAVFEVIEPNENAAREAASSS